MWLCRGRSRAQGGSRIVESVRAMCNRSRLLVVTQRAVAAASLRLRSVQASPSQPEFNSDDVDIAATTALRQRRCGHRRYYQAATFTLPLDPAVEIKFDFFWQPGFSSAKLAPVRGACNRGCRAHAKGVLNLPPRSFRGFGQGLGDLEQGNPASRRRLPSAGQFAPPARRSRGRNQP